MAAKHFQIKKSFNHLFKLKPIIFIQVSSTILKYWKLNPDSLGYISNSVLARAEYIFGVWNLTRGKHSYLVKGRLLVGIIILRFQASQKENCISIGKSCYNNSLIQKCNRLQYFHSPYLVWCYHQAAFFYQIVSTKMGNNCQDTYTYITTKSLKICGRPKDI